MGGSRRALLARLAGVASLPFVGAGGAAAQPGPGRLPPPVPPLRLEPPPGPPPARRLVWQPGHYVYGPRGYGWVPGRWVPVRRGRWEHGHWVYRRWGPAWVPGGWR